MSVSLEQELDRLFQLPLADVVKERDALAARLKKAGAKEDAARVKALKRPAPAAWALNQVRFRAPELLTSARTSAELVRRLHAEHEVDPARLRAAHEAQRKANRALIEAALAECERGGITSGAALHRKLVATLQGWLAGKGSEEPGRMTSELEASGFDAISEVGAAPPRAEVRPSEAPRVEVRVAAVTPSARPAVDAQVLSAARRELAALERQKSAADAELAQNVAQAERARRELERTEQRIAEAEQALRALRAQAEAERSELARAESSTEQAEGAKQRAEEALGRARAKLSALTNERS